MVVNFVPKDRLSYDIRGAKKSDAVAACPRGMKTPRSWPLPGLLARVRMEILYVALHVLHPATKRYMAEYQIINY